MAEIWADREVEGGGGAVHTCRATAAPSGSFTSVRMSLCSHEPQPRSSRSCSRRRCISSGGTAEAGCRYASGTGAGLAPPGAHCSPKRAAAGPPWAQRRARRGRAAGARMGRGLSDQFGAAYGWSGP